MSTNCIDCIKNERTKNETDGLCDDCRLQDCPNSKCSGRPITKIAGWAPGVFIICKSLCGKSVYGQNYKEAVKFWNLLKKGV